ncbi:MAG: TetR family transcriptional regulator [Bacteroidales bacterium]|nr:TetR family transcriptional regulator [Bacteroidales bacterium]
MKYLKWPDPMQYPKSYTRYRIIRAARKEFLRKGFKGASMRLIAAASGVSTSNIYNYFQSKDQIFREVLNPLLDAFSHLDFPDRNFDMVLASNILHLLHDPDQALLEMKRVLVPGGKLILPTYCHGKSLFTRTLSRISGIYSFKVKNRWSVRDYWSYVEYMGFRILKAEILGKPFPLVYLLAENKASQPMIKDPHN